MGFDMIAVCDAILQNPKPMHRRDERDAMSDSGIPAKGTYGPNLYDPRAPRFQMPELSDETKAEIAEAMNFDFTAYGWSKEAKADEIKRLSRDGDFESDVRDLLISLVNALPDDHWDDWDYQAIHSIPIDMAEWLTELQRNIDYSTREYPSMKRPPARFQDLRRVAYIISNLCRDDVTQLLMDDSLCPIHAVDWAICFDDEPEDCAQVRRIFPRSHDT